MKYHINPRTGNPGICRATIQCRFGGASSHFTSKEEARADYEETQERLSRKATSPKEAVENLEKDFKRGTETLDSVRRTDGSVFGSSVQSRAEDHWKQVKYLIAQYVDKGESWSDRRGYYHQVSDHLRGINREFGAGPVGNVAEAHRPLVEKLSQMEKDFRDLCGPEGAAKEEALGFYKKA